MVKKLERAHRRQRKARGGSNDLESHWRVHRSSKSLVEAQRKIEDRQARDGQTSSRELVEG